MRLSPSLTALAAGVAVAAPWLAARRVLRAADGLERFDEPAPEPMKAPSDVGPELDEVLAALRGAQSSFAGAGLAERRALVRAWLDELGEDVEHDCTVTPVDDETVRGEWVVPPAVDVSRRLLYVHGGAFEAGSPRSHRSMTTRLAASTGMAVLAVEYRLAPEHTRQDALDDIDAAWDLLCTTGPDGPAEAAALAVAGDSAGGNLALGLVHRTRDRAASRLPDAAVAFCPSTDHTFSGPSWRENIATDAFLGPRLGPIVSLPRELLVLGLWATTRIRPDDPRLSPLLDDLSGLPPTLVQVSDVEMLRDDGVRYARAAQAAGSPVQLQLWPSMVHAWQAFADLPEAAEALDEVVAFLAEHTGVGSSAAAADGQRARTIA